MLRIQTRITPVSAIAPFSDQSNSNAISSVSNTWHFYIRFTFTTKKRFLRRDKSLIVSCKSYSSGSRSWNRDDDEFLQAFVLTPETIRHYYLRRQGFLDKTKWRSSGNLFPVSIQAKEPNSNVSSWAHGFLRRFQSPTIFLKMACDRDLLLPIIVGEFAIEKLIDALKEDENGDFLNQFKFMKNLVGSLGYEVKMVRITERVVNTYYARIYLGKPGENSITSVDARPSDAINVAERCKAPIYVSKNIVSTDAIRIVYGKWRGNDAKSNYDVSLDSAAEGPDSLAEELDLLRKLNIAVSEERYNDAAMWRDQLTKLRMSKHEH
ncbi:bifunctional nuclease 2 isoform X2 [Magnolia sinica]|uniref:bifunctional nuclease 2 isoform X2 n=1 Tax=Magnolia sinica TaxID=86752 RepID=UPI00265975D2|nr:bifunctional nuclease 2 isoform X2 [Magnolia sinica]XP_058098378.1 bifunctional nuclease 2 isoform X2 [Magnolia sinica]XP_058098379.1 bifunctional nuclease 2 isoform X2 [Magnolia sinica]XP_058098380.1 bifunctional nuclease 2 isoform X2 [Magnolia sinica]